VNYPKIRIYSIPKAHILFEKTSILIKGIVEGELAFFVIINKK